MLELVCKNRQNGKVFRPPITCNFEFIITAYHLLIQLDNIVIVLIDQVLIKQFRHITELCRGVYMLAT